MPTYAHNKLLEEIQRIDALPGEDAQLAEWIKAQGHLNFLVSNSRSNEMVIYASGPYSFITSVIVPNEILFPLDKDDLLRWNGNPYSSIASYVCGGGREDVWIERTTSMDGSKTLEQGKDLIFARTFEGWSGQGYDYFEVNQEYTHLAGIHWRPEYSSYCHFDQNGDLEHLVSISTRENSAVALVSFSWSKLEEYLTISKCSLVRMFDFTLLRHTNFGGWHGDEKVINDADDLFYRQRFSGLAAYTRGVQILQPRRPPADVYRDFIGGWFTPEQREYAEFVAHDWRNNCITKISTDPRATTNYFEGNKNSLPFEVSPAFFRPEVLTKYKSDREKYRIEERSINCRSAWYLKGYDVNEAGQVHAYICDLRSLPYSEQLHWLSYNEDPKGTISKRAFINDFKGEFVDFRHPREHVMSILRGWTDRGVTWWNIRDEELIHRANTPLTASRDEWSGAFLDLSQLIMEGFEINAIRKMLDAQSVPYLPEDKSIVLLEKLITNSTGAAEAAILAGLRQAQSIRSKVKGHAGSSEGKRLADEAIAKHGSFTKHFEYVCQLIASELETIEHVCSTRAGS